MYSEYVKHFLKFEVLVCRYEIFASIIALNKYVSVGFK